MFRFASTLYTTSALPSVVMDILRVRPSDVMDGFWKNPYTHTHTHTPTRCYLVSISHQTYHHLACVCVCVPKWKGGNVSFRFSYFSGDIWNWLRFWIKKNGTYETSRHHVRCFSPITKPSSFIPAVQKLKKIQIWNCANDPIKKKTKQNACEILAGQIPVASGGGRSWRSAFMGRSRRRTGCGGSQQQAAIVGPHQLRTDFRQGECDCRHSRHVR